MKTIKITKWQWLIIEKRVLSQSDKWTSHCFHTMLDGMSAIQETIYLNGIPFCLIVVANNRSKAEVRVVIN